MTNTKIQKKINNKGLTLVELLVTVIILLLATSLIVLAVDFGVKSFNKSNRQAEGQILCASLATTVKDELRYAKDISSDGKTYNGGMSLVVVDESGNVVSSQGGSYANSGKIAKRNSNDNTTSSLVPSQTYVYNLRANFKNFVWTSGGEHPNFNITIEVIAPDGTSISEEKITVEPLNE